ncbi:MAG TPA: glycoside hydrolase domain-containing protein [Candidatus Limnocylindrales bacterium]|nr:glycoside hydrolase domain-containing protein [Candidatus Limnocylindrales bacterium]
MTLEGVDYDDGRPGGAALVAAGKLFAIRYLAYRGNPDPHKPLTLGEIDDLQAHGLAIVANFESTSNRVLDGAAAGEADAQDALADLKGLGFPSSCPVYFSADFDPQPQYFGRVDAYLTAAASVLGRARVGIYGGVDLLVHCRQAGTAFWFWMAGGWRHGKQPPSWCHLDQYETAGMGAKPINGADVDLDRALKANYGQWDAPPGGGPEEPVVNQTFVIKAQQSGTVVVHGAGHSYIRLLDGSLHSVPAGYSKHTDLEISLTPPIPGGSGDRSTAWLIGSEAAALLDVDVDFTPDPIPAPDCTAAIAADRAKAHIVYE